MKYRPEQPRMPVLYSTPNYTDHTASSCYPLSHHSNKGHTHTP